MSKSAPLHSRLFKTYPQFAENTLAYQRLEYAQFVPLIQKLDKNKRFITQKIGKSVEGRNIYQVSLGSGKTKVLLWSQMHGNEPTATMALADIFNFFAASGDDFDAYRSAILRKLSLHFIPMLNPDGVERFQRRNALGIDLNRDALRLCCPESQILKKACETLAPDFAFNLHDQHRFYSAGKQTAEPAAISFLAPAFNPEKQINPVRQRAMQLIGMLGDCLQAYAKQKIAKYNDDFNPRAFGDNIQKWGISTILVESGAYANDSEKQYIRQLNYVLLLQAFAFIAEGSYQKTSVEAYEKLPFNDDNLHSLLFRNVGYQLKEKRFSIDLAVRREPHSEASKEALRYQGTISEIGDLSHCCAYQEPNAAELEIVAGKVYPTILENEEALAKLQLETLLSEGYTAVRLKQFPKNRRYTDLPINILCGQAASDYGKIAFEQAANFTLEKAGETKFVVMNGFLYDLSDPSTYKHAHGMVFSD